jgi:hypothetical protein
MLHEFLSSNREQPLVEALRCELIDGSLPPGSAPPKP